MKTLLLCPELFARESGIQRILRVYLKALCESAGPGGRVDLLVLNDTALPEDGLARYGGGCPGSRLACRGGKARFLRAAVRMSADVDRVVCGHLRQLVAAWLARGLNSRIHYFAVAHGIEAWRPFSILERLALRGARRILCVSEYTRAEMLRRTGLPHWRLAVVPNALDPFFAGAAPSGPAPGGPPVILTVARLDAAERYKGVDHLIEAMPAVRQALPGARLRVVGAGDDLSRLVTLAGQRGVADAVEFTGFLDDRRLVEAYRGCTLFALPSRSEGFGIVFLEAMACGRPCLGARAGAIPEIIDDRTGVLVEYGDVGGIAAALAPALTRAWDHGQITARAEHFSYAAFRSRLVQTLESGSRPPWRTPAAG